MARRDKFSTIKPVRRTHRGKNIREIVSSPAWESFMGNIEFIPSRVTIIKPGMVGRPDLISNAAYGTPDYWWVVCAANRIIDPFEQLVAGKQIKIPIIT